MSYEALVFIQGLSIGLLVIESLYIFSKWKSRMHSYLFIYCFGTLINNLGYLLEMLAKSSEAALFGTQFCYLGKVYVSLSLFVLTMELCKIKIPQKVYMVLAVFHTCVFFLVLTCRSHKLYYTSFYYTEEGLFPHNVFKHGPFYFIYMLLMFLYLSIGFWVLIKKLFFEKIQENRILLCYLFASAATEGLGFVIFLLGITAGYDITALAYTISTIFMYIALFKYDLMDTLEVVKDYVVDNLSEGIIAVGGNEKIIYYNEPAKQLFQKIETEGGQVLEEVKQTIEAKEYIFKDDKIYMPKEQPFYQNGILRGNIYVMFDVTDKHRYTVELKKQKELAEAANASKSAFLSVVSHEIRTPMNAVVGMTDLLLRDKENLTGKQEKYLKNIRNSGSALVMIVNDILDQSKIEAGKMEIVEDAYELRPMVADVKMIIENRIGSKPVHLLYEIDDEIPQYLVGDSLRIRQILINLMNNAVKFTEEGYIRLSVKCVEEDKNRRALKFSVRDSGQGIKPEDLNKLGEAFTQVDVKKNHSKEGTGLGLSISRDFISLMGGQLEVASEYGKGSDFYFTIWQGVATSIDMNSASGVGKQAWQEEEQFTAPEARVLIVDDTDINLIVASELLKPLNMTVDTANSGEKAIELVKQKKYDVIFMDYMMPYMDGVEATEKIRALALKFHAEGKEDCADYVRSVPIIALSGDNSENTKEKFMRVGIDDFTEKPVELKRLKKLLLKWLPKEMIKADET